MYRTLLVPLDGSLFSARALGVATALARRTNATVHVVTVLDPSAYVPFVPGEVLVPVLDTEALAARRDADQDAIRAEAKRLTDAGVNAVGRLLEGTVVEAIAEYAHEISADLVIMTTHGRSGLERLWLGSVASSFLHRSPCPVFLVRPQGTTTPDLPTGKVLVPIDGSSFSEAILPHVGQFAEAAAMSIELFSVAIPNAIPMAPFGTEALLADDGDLTRQEETALNHLKKLATALPAGTTMEVSTDMTAARAIHERAREIGAGAVAMATHGRTGIARLVMGSVADKVLREVDLPMLLYRPTDDESEDAK